MSSSHIFDFRSPLDKEPTTARKPCVTSLLLRSGVLSGRWRVKVPLVWHDVQPAQRSELVWQTSGSKSVKQEPLIHAKLLSLGG